MHGEISFWNGSYILDQVSAILTAKETPYCSNLCSYLQQVMCI